MTKITDLFSKHRAIGIVGDRNSAKSSLALSKLIEIKEKYKIDVYVLGVETNLYDYLKSKKIKILYSIEDVLDLKIKNSLIYLDEFGDLFDTRSESKQKDKIKRFFNRLAHLNNYVMVSSAQVNFWNKFICSLIECYLVKQIDFEALVRGTTLRRKIISIKENTSDYRLEMPINTYYIITNEGLVEKCSFKYNENLDSKKDLTNPFMSKTETKADLKTETKADLKAEMKKCGKNKTKKFINKHKHKLISN